MAEYLIYFNQQWVGDHSEEWFRGRGPLSRAVVEEIKAAGAYVFAGGLEEEDGPVFSADATSGTLLFTDGPYVETKEFLGGLTIVDVPDEQTAKMWAENRGGVWLAAGGSPLQASGPSARSLMSRRSGHGEHAPGPEVLHEASQSADVWSGTVAGT
ncbi:YciI family protein [Hamadaea sp. NPDC050747]|uniref:YciI family protein n=1 Tax=Hamadaea sp. NPDC050747 TaxID=3155789 RepID=UPI0033C4B5AC